MAICPGQTDCLSTDSAVANVTYEECRGGPASSSVYGCVCWGVRARDIGFRLIAIAWLYCSLQELGNWPLFRNAPWQSDTCLYFIVDIWHL